MNDLPGDVSERLDHPLFVALKEGPTGKLSQIHTDQMETANSAGIQGSLSTNDGWGVAAPTSYTPVMVSFGDFVDVSQAWTGVAGFQEIFGSVYEPWVADPGQGEDVDLEGFIAGVVESGE